MRIILFVVATPLMVVGALSALTKSLLYFSE
jgi:hypothetical protein